MGISKKPFKVAGRDAWHYKIDGARKSLETKNLTEATRRLNRLRGLFFEGRLLRISGECSKSLGEFADEYLTWAMETRTHPTFRADRLALDKLVAEAGKTIRLDRIGRREADSLVAACRRAGNKPASINVHLRHLRSIFGKAVEWGHLKTNPLAGIKEVAKEQKAPAFLTKADAARFLAGIEDVDVRRLVAAYLSTGRRRSELIALAWEDIDLDAGRYLVRKAKRSLSRHYPIGDAFRAVLLSLPDRSGRLFPRWSSPDAVTHAVKRALRAAGHGDLRLHDLRHSFAVLFLEGGGNLRVLQDLLGHTEYRTTEIYAHVSDDMLRQEIGRVKFGPLDLGSGYNRGTGGGGSR